MRVIPDQDERDLAAMCRSLLAAECPTTLARAPAGERITAGLWKALTEAGVLGLAIEEQHGGSGGADVAPSLRAHPKGDGWRVSGVADFVADADLADVFVITADAGDCTLMCVADTRASGIGVEPVAMMGGHNAFTVRFDDVAVDEAGRRFGLTADAVVRPVDAAVPLQLVAAGWAVAIACGATMVPAKFSPSRFLSDIRPYRATYMNYVGKPLALVLSTPEQPDDADNTLRAAFGNEATERDIEEFARRFGCRVVDSFGSSEFAVVVMRDDGTPPGSIGKRYPGVSVYHAETVTECAPAVFDEDGALANFDEAVGELVNTYGVGGFTGYYNDPTATEERMRHGMYWSGDLAYRDADGWIYLAGRTADWMRVDGENLAAGPVERILQRLPEINHVAVYAVPDEHVGDQVMAAIVLSEGATLTPKEFEEFLASQPDLSPKAWPRYVRINAALPQTATNKILKRALIHEGASAGDGVLWEREAREQAYFVSDVTSGPGVRG